MPGCWSQLAHLVSPGMSAALHLHCLNTLTSPTRQPGSQRTLALKATISSTEVKGPSQISLAELQSSVLASHLQLSPGATSRYERNMEVSSPSHSYLLLVLKHQPFALPRRQRRTLTICWGGSSILPLVIIVLPMSFCLLQDFELSHFCSQGCDSSSRFATDGTCLSPNLREAQKAAPSTVRLLSRSSAGPGTSMATCISE